MRDILLILILPFLIYFSLKRPFIGLSLWLWTALVPMQTWTYGMATSVRWNLIFAMCTIVGVIFNKKTFQLRGNGLFILIIIFYFHASLSALLSDSMYYMMSAAWANYTKAILFFIMVVGVVKDKLHFDGLMFAGAMSVSVLAAMDGAKYILSGGGHVIQGISLAFNDNNLSALASLMCIPMLLYLNGQYGKDKLVRMVLLGVLFVNVVFVLGTGSRGGFLGLVFFFGYYFIYSKNKGSLLFVGLIIGSIALSLLGDEWFNRMDTIKTADDDSSFMGRVISWKMSLLLAMESPFLGGGFDAIINPIKWQLLIDDFDKLDFISTPQPGKSHVAHSIYFQVIGNQGFLGIFLFLIILLRALSGLNRVRMMSAPDDWIRHAATYTKIALAVFMLAGAVLNFAYRELLMVYLALVIALENIADSKRPSLGVRL